MSKRKFSLEPALTHKTRLEEICQAELAEAQTAYAREYAVLDSLSRLENAGWEQIKGKQALGELDLAAISLHMNELNALERRIEQQQLILAGLQEQARQKREKLIEISKEKKALEKLKDKRAKEIAQAENKAENKVMGDIATSQFLRRSTG